MTAAAGRVAGVAVPSSSGQSAGDFLVRVTSSCGTAQARNKETRRPPPSNPPVLCVVPEGRNGKRGGQFKANEQTMSDE